jgi:hypothetical protein
MIPLVARYHGVVFRQLVVDAERGIRIAAVDCQGRIDCFAVDDAAILIKYSSKRLSPWQFTFTPDQLLEQESLKDRFERVWLVLVCGNDGLVALDKEEVRALIGSRTHGVEWIRVGRNRSTQYRIAGSCGELARRKAQGLRELLNDIAVGGVKPGAANGS